MFYELPLPENEPSEPVEDVLRHRFYNRYPQTETIGLGLVHQVFSPGALGIHWYRLEIPTGTNELFSLFCPNPVFFVLFITIYSFIIAKRTRTLQYYMFIGRVRFHRIFETN